MNITALDKVFSLYIRQRDSVNGVGRCISCNKIIDWKKNHCGHFVNRRHMSTRFDEQNCNLQCISCNSFDEGNFEGYRRGLIEKYGEGTPEKLYIKKFNVCKISQFEVNMLTKLYKLKIKELNLNQ